MYLYRFIFLFIFLCSHRAYRK